MKNRYLALLAALLALTVLLTFPLASCGRGEKTETPEDEENEPAAEEPAPEEPEEGQIPSALVGTWTGVGTTEDGDSDIDLTVTINPDGSGDYEFDQSGYHETCPFSLSYEDNTFTVAVPEGSPIESVSGSWRLEDGSLILDITSVLPNGSTFSYTAVCGLD